MEQHRWSVAAACEGEREARTKPLQPGTPKVVELTHLRGRQQLVGRVSGAPTPSSASAARWRACTAGGSGVSSAARSRNAAAGAAPSRVRARSAGRSISSATVSSGHGAAWARCHARRSGSASGSVARPRPDAPPAGHRARPPGRRRSRPVGGESARGRRVRSILRLPLQPPRPLRSAAARPRATTGSRHNRFGRCGKQQLLRVARKHFELQVKTVFNAALQRRCGGKPESARRFGQSQPAGQLQQRERVTAGFSDDPVTHLLGISSRSQLDRVDLPGGRAAV